MKSVLHGLQTNISIRGGYTSSTGGEEKNREEKNREQCDGVNYSVTTVWGDNSKKEYEWEGKVIGKQISHILSDYQNEVDEHDMTHFEEILEKHDLSLDKEAGTFEQFKSRGFDNYRNRCLHHHVSSRFSNTFTTTTS